MGPDPHSCTIARCREEYSCFWYRRTDCASGCSSNKHHVLFSAFACSVQIRCKRLSSSIVTYSYAVEYLRFTDRRQACDIGDIYILHPSPRSPFDPLSGAPGLIIHINMSSKAPQRGRSSSGQHGRNAGGTSTSERKIQRRDISEGLIVPPIGTLDKPEATAGEDIVLKDVTHVGSYNWTNAKKPTIIVPGALSHVPTL